MSTASDSADEFVKMMLDGTEVVALSLIHI